MTQIMTMETPRNGPTILINSFLHHTHSITIIINGDGLAGWRVGGRAAGWVGRWHWWMAWWVGWRAGGCSAGKT